MYVPGNHDHVLWGRDLDQSFGEAGVPANGSSGWSSHLFDTNGAANATRAGRTEMLTSTIHRRPGLRHLEFELRYPTFAVESARPRVVAFHHGHFTEASSASISALRRAAFPRELSSRTTWDHDDESSPWVEFVWSTLARPGAFGADVGVVHAMIQDPQGARVVAANLGGAVGSVLPTWMPPQLRRTAGRYC